MNAVVLHFKIPLTLKLFKKKMHAAGADSNFAGANRNFAGACSINHSFTDIPDDKRQHKIQGGDWKFTN